MDEQPKKSSLRGRGKDIMRGFFNKGEQRPPKSEEEPYFEDEEALLNWMSEAETAPATVSDTGSVPMPDPASLYAEPDFDAIFSPQETPVNEVKLPTEQRPAELEDLFREDDPTFDDLFGDMVPEATALEDDFPQEPMVSGEIMPDSPEMGALRGMSQPDPVAPPVLGEFENMPESLAQVEDFGASEADALAPELPDFGAVMGFEETTDQVDDLVTDATMYEQPVMDQFSVPLPTPPTDEEAMAMPVHEELDFGFAEQHEDDFSLELEEPVAEVFAEFSDPNAPMPEEADARIIPDGLDDEPAPRPERRSPQAQFVPAEEFYSDEADEPVLTPLYSEAMPPVEAAVEPDWLAEEDLIQAEPVGYEEPVARAYEPAMETVEDVEAIPHQEANMQAVDLSTQQVDRGALAGITPQEPEELPPGQRPVEAYFDYDEFEEEQNVADAPTLMLRPEIPAETLYETPAPPPPVETAYELEEAMPDSMDDLISARYSEVNPTPTPPEPEPEYEEAAPYAYDTPFALEDDDQFEDVPEVGGTQPDYELDESGEVVPTRSGLLLTDMQGAESEDPFGEREVRRPAREIFQAGTVTPDASLLAMLVDDARIRELFNQIEALQEEVVNSVRGERGNTDTYQSELLEASNMLLQSRENYDEARAIIYRVRADINRERRVSQDIERYRPLLTFTFVATAIIAMTLLFLGNFFVDMAEDVGLAILGNGYFAAIFGMLGALWFGYRKMHTHTTIDRDFDPIHLNWYFVNPIMGLLTGFLVYLFLLSTTLTSLNDSNFEVIGFSPMTWVAAVAFGYNQNRLVNMLGSAGDRVSTQDSTRQ